jgi:hypothetical protein
MITTARILSISIPLIWCGMIAAISFIEAPLKFRAPGVTLPIGLGIGKLVFHALNRVECVFSICWIITSVIGKTTYYDLVIPLLIGAILWTETSWLLPHLDLRATQIQEGLQPSGKSLHLYYAAGEVIKFVLLAGSALIPLFKIIKNTSI